MINFEIGYCPIDEYDDGRDDRVQESVLSVGLYTLMLYLKGPSGFRAAKYPTQIRDIEQQNTGLCKIEFTILNGDLNPASEGQAQLHDGYWQRAASAMITVGQNETREGYFKDYEDDQDHELQAILASVDTLAYA